MSALMQTLMQVSLSASIMILTVLVMRRAFRNSVPRRTLSTLWDIVAIRLLIPVALTSPWSLWSLLQAPVTGPTAAVRHVQTVVQATAEQGAVVTPGASVVSETIDGFAVAAGIWITVLAAMAACFVLTHVRGMRVYALSLPCESTFVRTWLQSHTLRRTIQVRVSDRIDAPLTYGMLKPVILLPSGMELGDPAALACILEHEYEHIRRFDTLRKVLLAGLLCVYWFNPLMWVMYVLANRDMEVACDENALKSGLERESYALVLLDTEERRTRLSLIASHFGASATEERIRNIMKHKRTSIVAVITTIAVLCVVTTVLACSPGEATMASPDQSTHPEVMTGWYPAGHDGATETNDMIAVTELLANGSNGETQYSADGGETWMSEAEYEEKYGVPDIEWWTYDAFKKWLDEEKVTLSSIIGSRGYTSSEGWFTWDQKRVDDTIAMYEQMLENMKYGVRYSKTVFLADGTGVGAAATTTESGGWTEMTGEALAMQEASETTAVETGEGITEEKSLRFEALKPFGLTLDAQGHPRYKGELVRCLVDGTAVGEGYGVRSVYWDDNGTIDLHTLWEPTDRSDGSQNPFGKLVGVAKTGDAAFDADLIQASLYTGPNVAISEATTTIRSEEELDALLRSYEPFGLEWNENDQALRMSWNGKPVHSLYDTETGTWFANNLRGSELPDDALDLETVYENGTLRGLRAVSRDGDASTEQMAEVIYGESIQSGSNASSVHGDSRVEQVTEAAYADGTATDGRTLEDILSQYTPYGLTVVPRENGFVSLYWDGKRVRFFSDERPNGGTFSYSDPDFKPYMSNGLHVYTVYDESGKLTGLRTD